MLKESAKEGSAPKQEQLVKKEARSGGEACEGEPKPKQEDDRSPETAGHIAITDGLPSVESGGLNVDTVDEAG
jgi:hypothetical protein